jgi:hypothetical protein
LALIKCERQSRRLLTYLVYQYPWCSKENVPELRKALAERRNVYFHGVVAGWDALYPRTVADLVGTSHARLWPRLVEAGRYRNKVFHGQLTANGLSRTALRSLIDDIRAWCELLARSAIEEVGYDGFVRNSFRKAVNPLLHETYKEQLADVAAYRDFIARTMTR